MRSAEGRYVAEGVTLLSEALQAGVAVESVYAAPDAPADLLDRAASAGVRIFGLAPGVLERVAETTTPQPVLAVLPIPTTRLEDLRLASLIVVGVELRDPGNAGTLMRSARAAGAGGVVLCGESVDAYNPKTVRASAGAIFGLPLVQAGPASEVMDRLADWGITRLAAVAKGGRDPAEVDLTAPFALVVGNEAHGLDRGALATVEGSVTIPMAADTESLNVGVATAVICFEAARQRRGAGGSA
ncbi:MAG TPA: RNA methyltransferase [Acidimicrobiales bacterium]|nr:RNA methyltransferase [Acidimicrobiales bacterium]